MFNKLKQFKDIRDKAKTMQNALAGERVNVTSSGVHLTMNGNLELTDVQIDIELLTADKKTKLQHAFIDAHKDAMKKMQRIMAMKMKEMGGLPNIPGLS